MEEFKLSDGVDKQKVFIIKLSKLEDRLEPKFYTTKYSENLKKIKTSKYSLSYLNQVTQVISDGTHFTPTYVDKGIKFLSVKDVRKSQINFNDSKYITEEEAKELDKRCKPKKGDVLLTKIGATYGFAATVESNERFQIFVSLALLRPNSKVLSKYLEVFLNTSMAYTQFERFIKGAGVPDLHLEDIRKILIPIPSLDIQTKIVDCYFQKYEEKQQKEAEAQALLDSIDNYLLGELGINLPTEYKQEGDALSMAADMKVAYSIGSSGVELDRENLLVKKGRIFLTTFSKITGQRIVPLFYYWKTDRLLQGTYPAVPLKSIVHSFKSGIGAGKQDQEDEENGYIQIRPTNIGEFGKLLFSRNVYLPHSTLTDLLDIDDVLFNNTNSQDLVGKTSIVKDNRKLGYSNHITVLKADSDKLLPDYLCYILNCFQKNKVFYSICTNWNNQSGIGVDILKKVSVPLPPLNKQQEIIRRIDAIKVKASKLHSDATLILQTAKQQVEQMVLGS